MQVFIRNIWPFLSIEGTKVLVQSLLIRSVLCATRPSDLIQNIAARLVSNLPKFANITPLQFSHYWFIVALKRWWVPAMPEIDQPPTDHMLPFTRLPLSLLHIWTGPKIPQGRRKTSKILLYSSAQVVKMNFPWLNFQVVELQLVFVFFFWKDPPIHQTLKLAII